MQQVDLNICKSGETALALQKLLQEIEIIMTAEDQTVITNYDPSNSLDKFLWHTGVSAEQVNSRVRDIIYANCVIPSKMRVDVDCKFLETANARRDMLFIEIQVFASNKYVKQLIYTVQ